MILRIRNEQITGALNGLIQKCSLIVNLKAHTVEVITGMERRSCRASLQLLKASMDPEIDPVLKVVILVSGP